MRAHLRGTTARWMAARQQTLEDLLGVALRDTDLTVDRLANVLTMLSEPADEAALDQALLADWLRVYRLLRERARLDSTMVMPRAILSRWAGAPWPIGWTNRPQPQRQT